jgi:hypothetical protein
MHPRDPPAPSVRRGIKITPARTGIGPHSMVTTLCSGIVCTRKTAASPSNPRLLVVGPPPGTSLLSSRRSRQRLGTGEALPPPVVSLQQSHYLHVSSACVSKPCPGCGLPRDICPPSITRRNPSLSRWLLFRPFHMSIASIRCHSWKLPGPEGFHFQGLRAGT